MPRKALLCLQRGDGEKQSTTKILALNTHIKRHPGVESPEEAPRAFEQEDSHYVGRVCFIDRLPGLSTIPDRTEITTNQEESPGSMIAPLSDGNADGMSRSSEETVVIDERAASPALFKITMDATKTGPTTATPKSVPISGPAATSDAHASVQPS